MALEWRHVPNEHVAILAPSWDACTSAPRSACPRKYGTPCVRLWCVTYLEEATPRHMPVHGAVGCNLLPLWRAILTCATELRGHLHVHPQSVFTIVVEPHILTERMLQSTELLAFVAAAHAIHVVLLQICLLCPP